MPDYVKLAIGAEIVIQVKTVEINKEGKWPDYHLTATDGRIVVAPKQALDRQLERLTLTPLELVGHYVRVERAPNKEDANKSWWNLSLANKADAVPAPSKRLASPPDTRTTGQRIIDEAIPEDGPPAHHRDVPLPDNEDVGSEAVAGPLDARKVALREAIESAYIWALDVAIRAQVGQGITPTSDSIQAGAATVLIQAERRGAI
jgi:hypothetical protein